VEEVEEALALAAGGGGLADEDATGVSTAVANVLSRRPVDESATMQSHCTNALTTACRAQRRRTRPD
jgi:hypothetical protein